MFNSSAQTKSVSGSATSIQRETALRETALLGTEAIAKLLGLVAASVLAGAGVNALTRAAAAQDGCFMVNEAGQTISLGALCGYGSGTATGSTPTARSQKAVPGNSVQVPIRRRLGRTPVIQVTFNGNRSYDMILDTGASGTLITSAMAKELGVKPNGVFQAQIADGSSVQFVMGRLKSISVKNAKVQNVDVAIAPDMEIGLLGHDFFGDFDISIKESAVEFTQR